ncbi:MAG: response regulator [Planctomycetota bacterium]|nr:response regulator [Planctomycetota bacterium]
MSGRTVLILDNDPQFVEILSKAFTNRLWHVKSAANVAAALESMKEGPATLFVVNTQSPNPNGLEFLTVVRQRGDMTRAICLAGAESGPAKEAAAKLGGIYRVLAKPVDVEALLTASDNAVGGTLVKRKLNVFVAVKEKESLESIEKAVKAAHFDFASAATGDEAVQKLAAAPRPFDFALLDLDMPGLSGPALAQAATAHTPKTFLMTLTGTATADSATTVLTKGIDHVLKKPVDAAEFLRMLDRLCVKADEKRHRAEHEEERARETIFTKLLRLIRRVTGVPALTRPGHVVRSMALVLLGIVVCLALLRVVGEIETMMARHTGSIMGFFDKMESYLKGTESGEVQRELERRQHR